MGSVTTWLGCSSSMVRGRISRGVEYKSVNILESDILRNAMKQYSNWPTFPQVYIKGTFVGGCDIVKEMHRDGSLEELLMKENLLK